MPHVSRVIFLMKITFKMTRFIQSLQENKLVTRVVIPTLPFTTGKKEQPGPLRRPRQPRRLHRVHLLRLRRREDLQLVSTG